MSLRSVTNCWFISAYFLVFLIIVFSLTPSLLIQESIAHIPQGENLSHLVPYFFLMVFFSKTYSNRIHPVRIGLALTVLGVSIEFLQLLVPDRGFDLNDILFNSIGVIMGLLFFWATTRSWSYL